MSHSTYKYLLLHTRTCNSIYVSILLFHSLPQVIFLYLAIHHPFISIFLVICMYVLPYIHASSSLVTLDILVLLVLSFSLLHMTGGGESGMRDWWRRGRNACDQSMGGRRLCLYVILTWAGNEHLSQCTQTDVRLDRYRGRQTGGQADTLHYVA